MVEQKETIEHSLYKHVDEKDADAIAFTFVNPNKQVFFPFKFPEIKPDEIRANVTYTGLCHSDVLHGRSQWFEAKYPITPGHEIMGVVSQIGADVKDFKVGDTVGFGVQRDSCGNCRFCGEQDREVLCQNVKSKYTYDPYFGGYATQLQQPAKFFYKLPEGFDARRGPPLFCAGATVWSPITRFIKKGDITAVLGIGGLGHLAVQFLAKMGHEVVALTSSDDKKDFILSLGATKVVNVNKEEEFKAIEGKNNGVVNTHTT